MSFLPEDYKNIPTNSNYMQLQNRENIFRVLSSAVVGWEYWTVNKKPVLAKERWTSIPDDIKTDENGNFRFDHFSPIDH